MARLTSCAALDGQPATPGERQACWSYLPAVPAAAGDGQANELRGSQWPACNTRRTPGLLVLSSCSAGDGQANGRRGSRWPACNTRRTPGLLVHAIIAMIMQAGGRNYAGITVDRGEHLPRGNFSTEERCLLHSCKPASIQVPRNAVISFPKWFHLR